MTRWNKRRQLPSLMWPTGDGHKRKNDWAM